MLSALMAEEMHEAAENRESTFKNMLFAHAFVTQNKELFVKLYPEDFGMSAEDEAALDYDVPETAADVERMMNELRATGWSGT